MAAERATAEDVKRLKATFRRMAAAAKKRYRYIVYATAPEMIETSVRRNAEIVRAIERGDGARARQLTEHLILEAGQLMIKHLPDDATD